MAGEGNVKPYLIVMVHLRGTNINYVGTIYRMKMLIELAEVNQFFCILKMTKEIPMTIENKLGITNSAELAKEEERLSKMQAIKLFESDALANLPAGKFSTLPFIHEYLFRDIYSFAGEIRDVNIAKGNFRFAPLMYLREAL